MTDGTYNGWSNRATWNVALWLDNTQLLQRCTRDLNARALKSFCLRLWTAGETPDGDKLSEVDWQEIVQHNEAE